MKFFQLLSSSLRTFLRTRRSEREKLWNEIIIFQFRRIKSVIEKSEIYGRCCGVDLRLEHVWVGFELPKAGVVLARVNDACIDELTLTCRIFSFYLVVFAFEINIWFDPCIWLFCLFKNIYIESLILIPRMRVIKILNYKESIWKNHISFLELFKFIVVFFFYLSKL